MRHLFTRAVPRPLAHGARPLFALLLLIGLLGPVGLGPRPLAAAGCTVTTNADGGTGSLREKLADTSCPTITFQAELASPIALTSGPLIIGRSVTVTGPGAASLTLDGGNAYADEATVRFAAIGDLRGLAVVHNNRAVVARVAGDYSLAQRHGEAGLAAGSAWSLEEAIMRAHASLGPKD